MADLSKAKPADLILVTDIHPDHFDPAAVEKLRKPGAPVVVPPAVAEAKKIPNTTVMLNATMRTNQEALAGITVIAVPAYNVQRGPAPGQFYHPRGRGQGYLLIFSDKLAAARLKEAGSAYVAGGHGVRAGDGDLGERRRRGPDAHEPAVHDDAGGSGDVREGVQTEGGHPVSLHGTEAGGVRGSAEGASRSRFVFSTFTPRVRNRKTPNSQDANSQTGSREGALELEVGRWELSLPHSKAVLHAKLHDARRAAHRGDSAEGA
jgi:hypothetical protein